jgi:hypothetical protein
MLHGTMMAEPDAGSAAPRQDPTGPVQPSDPGGSGPPPQEPQTVVLAKGTFLKFGVLLFGSLILTISGILAFYWKHHYESTTHQNDMTIHLKSGERPKFETKAEAKASRKRTVRIIKAHVNIKLREVRVDQKAQIQRLGDELKASQQAQIRQVLTEVKRTRRDVRAYTSP